MLQYLLFSANADLYLFKLKPQGVTISVLEGLRFYMHVFKECYDSDGHQCQQNEQPPLA